MQRIIFPIKATALEHYQVSSTQIDKDRKIDKEIQKNLDKQIQREKCIARYRKIDIGIERQIGIKNIQI